MEMQLLEYRIGFSRKKIRDRIKNGAEIEESLEASCIFFPNFREDTVYGLFMAQNISLYLLI